MSHPPINPQKDVKWRDSSFARMDWKYISEKNAYSYPLLISLKKPAVSSFFLVHAFEMNVKKGQRCLGCCIATKKINSKNLQNRDHFLMFTNDFYLIAYPVLLSDWVVCVFVEAWSVEVFLDFGQPLNVLGLGHLLVNRLKDIAGPLNTSAKKGGKSLATSFTRRGI